MESFIRSLPIGVFLAMVGFLLIAAGIMVFAALHARRRAALVKATPTTNIGMATDGYREFEGRAEAIGDTPIVSPLTDTACVWYHARVEEYVPERQRQTPHWSTVRDESSWAPFLIRDDTGVCVVHPGGADVTATDKSVWKGATARPTDRNPPKIPTADVTPPLVEGAGTRNATFRYTEERIYAGDPLLVLGDYANSRFTGSDTSDEEMADAEADAEVGSDENESWESDSVVQSLSEQARQVTTASVSKGASGKPFIVSTTLQAVGIAQAEMGSQAALAMAVAPVALAAFLLWVRFG
jgi:hypothetical protein